jgi:hypothetical protein
MTPINDRNEEKIMQYLLMLYADEAGWDTLSETEQEQGIAAYHAYSDRS